MPLPAAKLNEFYGRPTSVPPVQVQGRLPWLPRNGAGTVQVVLAHPLIADLFVACCHEAARRSSWVPGRVDSYYPREIRGFRKPAGWRLGDDGTSRHSWGVAFDFFASPAGVYPPGGVWTPENPVPAEFAGAFTDRGFTWGRNFKRRDDPHIEFSAAPPVQPSPADGVGLVDWLSAMLKQGDVGADVWDLQLMLMALGEQLEPSGVFDGATDAAVRRVQAACGLVVDGLVGPRTEAVMGGLIAGPGPAKIVEQAFRVILGREPDPTGAVYWQERISRGLVIPDLYLSLWETDEAVLRRTPPPAVPPVDERPPVPVPGRLEMIRAAALGIVDLVDGS